MNFRTIKYDRKRGILGTLTLGSDRRDNYRHPYVYSIKKIEISDNKHIPIYLLPSVINTTSIPASGAQETISYSLSYRVKSINLKHNYLDPMYKSFSKGVMDMFSGSGRGYGNHLNKIEINGDILYVARGAIYDKDLDPLILITIKYLNIDRLRLQYGDRELDRNSMTIFINRKVFNEEFKTANTTIYNNLHRKFISPLMEEAIRVEIKDNIDFSVTVQDISYEMHLDYKQILLDNIEEIKKIDVYQYYKQQYGQQYLD